MAPRIAKIDHVHISVVDRSAAERWYEKVLGFTRVKELEFWAPDGGPLTIQDADGTVHLALFEGTPMKRPSTVAFGVSANDFMKWKNYLFTEIGMRLEAEDHAASWSLYFSDPDGNPFEITTYEYEAVAKALAAA